MANIIAEASVKLSKQVFINAIKSKNKALGEIAGIAWDKIESIVRTKFDERKFLEEYKAEIKSLYPDRYEQIFPTVERIVKDNNLWQTLLDDEFDFEKVANTLIKQSLSPQEARDLDDTDVAGIKIGLIIMIERSYETLCSLDDEDVKKWLVEQTAKNGHPIEKQEIKIEELRLFFNQQAAASESVLKLVTEEKKRNDEQDKRLDDYDKRFRNVEIGLVRHNADRAEAFKERWNKYLFLEDDKENPEGKKKLSEVYIIPQVKDSAKKSSSELDKFLKKKPQPFTLFLGQPGVGKSTLISAYLNDVFCPCESSRSVFKFSDFAGRDFWGKPAEDAAEAFYAAIGIETPMDLNNRIIFLDGFDEISMGRTARVQFLIALRNWLNDEDVRNCKLFVTCRTNYMEEELMKAQLSRIEIQPFNGEQIRRFCRIYKKGIHTNTIEKLQGRQDLYGFPVLLYIVLVTGVYEENAKNAVEIYKELFSKLYKRSWDSKNKANGHLFTTAYEKFYNRFAQKMATYMFEHDDAAEGCPIEKIKEFGEDLKKELNVPKEAPNLFGGFFNTGLPENENNVFFVHRTIYEYFFTGYLAETARAHMEDADSDWFVNKFCEKIQYRNMSEEMLEYFFNHSGDEKKKIVGRIKAELKKALDQEQLSTEPKLVDRIRNEAYVLANCLRMVSKASEGDDGWEVDSHKLERYLQLSSQADSAIQFILSNGNLFRAALFRADLGNAVLNGANLEKADLQGAILVNAQLERAYLKGAHLEGADLERANLRGTDLKGAHLEGAHLERAELNGAYLVDVHLEEAHLEGVNLEGADLEGANLFTANLTLADLNGAHLEWANLARANLEGADLTGAYYDEDTVFPEGFDIKGKGMRFVMPNGRIKDIDSDKNSEEEPL